MNRIIKRMCAFMLCAMLISNIFFSSYVQAAEMSDQERLEANAQVYKILKELGINSVISVGYLFEYLLSSYGIVTGGGDYSTLRDNWKDCYSDIYSTWSSDDITVNYDNDTNLAESVTFSKTLGDTLLKSFKEYADEKTSDEKGYTLHQTVPVGKISSIYFDCKSVYYSLVNIINNNADGLIGAVLSPYEGNTSFFYDLVYDYYYVLNPSSYTTIDGARHERISTYKSYSTQVAYTKRYYLHSNVEGFEFSDDKSDSFNGDIFDLPYADTSRIVINWCDYDYYKAHADYGYNPLTQGSYIISKTGVSIPVFDSLDALVDYSVANGLYYTSSAYTGEGKEITIDLDTLNDILDGYYDGMYDMLQQLIADSSFTLDPEQLQELVDAVQSSYGLIADSLKVQTSILSDMIDRLSSILGYLKNILSQLKQIKWLTAIDTVFDGLGLLTDLADWLSDFLGDTASGVVALSDIFDDVSDSLSRKFPFSIPWDIEFLLEYFADTPAVPHFELPFKMEKYGIDYTIEIDFSRFEILSKLSRSILTSVFIIGLMRLTERVVKIKENA